ncbi:hypothetical protein Pa4123_50750 [Phytohabitans aurantiacus]|uniref:Type I restriction modification DNA specificity domain-containing protein n=2 Tax=Phytohabitans aurantiacus TaxID=3016789 RepID=A0ABQ5QZ18_9ACTN|nr:hypothetical protein Pa4123_50750 [Phytohabitans aurantiacus]
MRHVVRNIVEKSDGSPQPFVGLESIEGNAGRLSADELPIKSATDSLRHQKGDVLFSKLRPYLAKSLMADRPGTGTGELLVLRPTPQMEPRYLLYMTLSRPWLEWAEMTSYGSKMPRTSWDAIAECPLWLPSFQEQRRIAHFLDTETARIDRLRASMIDALSLLDERDRTTIDNVFRDGDHSRQIRRLVAKWIDYRGATPTKTEHGVPLITAGNIFNGRVDYGRSPEFISENDYDSWMRRGLPRSGDVLLTTEAPLGEVAILNDPAVALAQRIILIRPHQALDAHWIYWYFRSPLGKSELLRRATGSTALGIKADRLRSVPVPVFDDAEKQQRIKNLEIGIKSTLRLRSPIGRQLELLAERRQALITAAVTGQFDVTTGRGADLS